MIDTGLASLGGSQSLLVKQEIFKVELFFILSYTAAASHFILNLRLTV